MGLKKFLFVLILLACETDRVIFLKNKNEPDIDHIAMVSPQDRSFRLESRRFVLNKIKRTLTLDTLYDKKMLDYFRSKKVNLRFVLDKGEVFKFKDVQLVSEKNKIPFEEKKTQNFFQTVQISNDAGIFFDYVLQVKIALNHNIDFTEFKVTQIPQKFSIDHKAKTISVELSYDRTIAQNLDKLYVTPVFKIEKNAKFFSRNQPIKSNTDRIRTTKQKINRKNIYKAPIKIVPHFGEKKAVDYEMIIRISLEMIFEKLEKVYQNNLTIPASELIGRVENLPAGYEILSISDVSDTNIAQIDTKSLKILHVGDFTFKMLLGPKGGGDPRLQKTIQCPVKIKKQPAPNLSFELLQKTYQSGGEFTTQEIQDQLRTPILAAGYVLKSIGAIADSDLLEKSDKKLLMKNKAGTTDVTFVFSHPLKEDKTLTGSVKIEKMPAENFGFNKLTKRYQDNGKFLKQEILNKLTLGDETGYSLKNVENFSNADFKSLDPVTKEILFVEKLGDFTADLILEHPYKQNARVNANFEITRGLKENLTVTTPLTTKYADNLIITQAQILGHITGNTDKYTISKIDNISNSENALKLGNGLSISKKGNFTAKVDFVHPLKEPTDLVVSFFVRRGDPLVFTFTPLNFPYDITNSRILNATLVNQIQPAAKRLGYTLSEITDISDSTIASRGHTNDYISYTKTGTFTANLHYENPNRQNSVIDATITIEKQPAPNITFNKLTRVYGAMGNVISKNALKNQLTPSVAAAGYTFKSLTLPNENIVKKISNPFNPLMVEKAGTVTATMTFEHAYKADKTLPCEIQIDKAAAPADFTITKIMEFPFVFSKKILKDDFYKKLNPNHKNYRIKEIKDFTPNEPAINEVTTDAEKSMIYKNKGKFTCTVVFESDNYADIEETGVEIDVKLKDNLFQLKADRTYRINYFTQLRNGNYLAVGSVQLSTGKYPYLLVFDSDLRTVSEKEYLLKKHDIFMKALELTDGSLVVLSNYNDTSSVGAAGYVKLFKLSVGSNYKTIAEEKSLILGADPTVAADMNFSQSPDNAGGYVIACSTYSSSKNTLTLIHAKSDMTVKEYSEKADYDSLGDFVPTKMVTSQDGKTSILVGSVKNSANEKQGFAVGLTKELGASGKYYKKIKFKRYGSVHGGNYEDVFIQNGTDNFYCSGYESTVTGHKYATIRRFSQTDNSDFRKYDVSDNQKKTNCRQIKLRPDGKIAFTQDDENISANSVPLIYGLFDRTNGSSVRRKLIKKDTSSPSGGATTDIKLVRFAFYEKTKPGSPKEEGLIILSQPKQNPLQRGVWVVKIRNK